MASSSTTVIANSGVTSVLHTDKFLLGSEVSDLLTKDDNHGIITFGPGGSDVKSENEIMFTTRRVNEKANLQTLNNRFAMYTRKVRALEDQNEALLIELAKFENRTETDWDEIYAPKIAAARRDVTTESTIKSAVLSQRDQFQSQVATWRAKYEQQVARYQELLALKSTINTSSSSVEASMKTEISANEAELASLTTSFKSEISDLRAQVKNAGEIHVIQCCEDNDIQIELDRMRNYYESLNQKMLVSLVAKKKEVAVVKKSEEVVVDNSEFEAAELEISSLSIKVSSLKMELEQLQFAKSSLVAKMAETQAGYKAEYVLKEAQCVSAETDYKNLKLAMAAQLKKYAELMNTKIGLDMEIATYRKLVDSETKKLDRYDNAISFENLHKFYAYSSEKEGTGKVINLSKAQWNKIETDAKEIKITEHVRPIDISKTKLGTNPYFSGNLDFSDLDVSNAKYESNSTANTKTW